MPRHTTGVAIFGEFTLGLLTVISGGPETSGRLGVSLDLTFHVQ